jgi:hypothetical protein
MKEIENNVIKKYEYKQGVNTYYIYVIENDSMYEFYLQNKDYGVMTLMYGLMKEKGIDNCITILEEHLLDFINDYKEEHEDIPLF